MLSMLSPLVIILNKQYTVHKRKYTNLLPGLISASINNIWCSSNIVESHVMELFLSTKASIVEFNFKSSFFISCTSSFSFFLSLKSFSRFVKRWSTCLLKLDIFAVSLFQVAFHEKSLDTSFWFSEAHKYYSSLPDTHGIRSNNFLLLQRECFGISETPHEERYLSIVRGAMLKTELRQYL